MEKLAMLAMGAALGACLRWALGSGFNPLLPDFPTGALVANWLGSFLIGLAFVPVIAAAEKELCTLFLVTKKLCGAGP